MTTTQRTFYRDAKRYAVPARLDDLAGPAHGRLELPVNVYWGPNPVVDLDTEDGLAKAYEAVIQEGRVEDLVSVVNPVRLRRAWDVLLLPARARMAWEERFPSLTA